MKRRAFITLLASTFIALPCVTFAQQRNKVFRVGMLSFRNSRSLPLFEGFIQGLKEHGYAEGENLVIEFRNAQGQLERLHGLAAELVNLQVDVIVVFGPEIPLKAAHQATRIIPIVAAAVNYDPLAKGYVDSLSRPGGNVTGLFFMQQTLAPKSLQLLRELLPQVTQVFVLYDVHSADQLPSIAAASQSLGIRLESLELQNPPYDFESAMATAVQAHAEALVVLGSPIFFAQRTEVVAAAASHRLPAIYPFRHWVELGGLMSYGSNLFGMYRYASTYVNKILQGAKPADLPVEQPAIFELAINLKAAKALGLTVPPSILLQATEVIE